MSGRAPDVIFDENCGFLLQLRNGTVIAVEIDRDLHAKIQGAELDLKAYTPLKVPPQIRKGP